MTAVRILYNKVLFFFIEAALLKSYISHNAKFGLRCQLSKLMTYARSEILDVMLMTVQVGFYLTVDSIPDSSI
jgi:hypothetical protein